MNTTTRIVNISGLSLPADVPTDASSFDEMCGETGACCAFGVENALWRGYASKVRTVVGAALKAQKALEANEGETFDKFVKRILAEGQITTEEYNILGASAVTAAGVTFASSLKSEGRASIGKEYVEGAENLIAAWAAGQGTAEATLQKIRQHVPHATLADPTDVTALAQLLRARKKAIDQASLL